MFSVFSIVNEKITFLLLCQDGGMEENTDFLFKWGSTFLSKSRIWQKFDEGPTWWCHIWVQEHYNERMFIQTTLWLVFFHLIAFLLINSI